MSDAYLQILLLLGYLAIGLISVTFPIYAICVTYLQREKWESDKEREQRIQKLKRNIAELAAKLSAEKEFSERFKQIEEEKQQCDSELESLELRVGHLTAKGAVGKPLLYLCLSLLFTGTGIGYYYLGSENVVFSAGVASAICSVAATYNLYKTLSAVEYAALRPARTVGFEVGFRVGNKLEKTEKIKLGQSSVIRIAAMTDDDDVENFKLYVTIPLELGIQESEAEGLNITNFPDYSVVLCETAFLPKSTSLGCRLTPTPTKTGEFSIDVCVNGKGIYGHRTKLTLVVT